MCNSSGTSSEMRSRRLGRDAIGCEARANKVTRRPPFSCYVSHFHWLSFLPAYGHSRAYGECLACPGLSVSTHAYSMQSRTPCARVYLSISASLFSAPSPAFAHSVPAECNTDLAWFHEAHGARYERAQLGTDGQPAAYMMYL
jgi:hypothetical protein